MTMSLLLTTAISQGSAGAATHLRCGG